MIPKYKKKITKLMDYKEFKQGIQFLSIIERAFMSVLFFTGCRVSEAIALTDRDLTHLEEMIYIQFYRLKLSPEHEIVKKYLELGSWKLADIHPQEGKRAISKVLDHHFRHCLHALLQETEANDVKTT